MIKKRFIDRIFEKEAIYFVVVISFVWKIELTISRQTKITHDQKYDHCYAHAHYNTGNGMKRLFELFNHPLIIWIDLRRGDKGLNGWKLKTRHS